MQVSLWKAKKDFFRMTARIELRTGPRGGERFFWIQPTHTMSDKPQNQEDSTVHLLHVDSHVLKSPMEWDRCVRRVCPAADSSRWRTMPGCDAGENRANHNGLPQQYYYLLQSADGAPGYVLLRPRTNMHRTVFLGFSEFDQTV